MSMRAVRSKVLVGCVCCAGVGCALCLTGVEHSSCLWHANVECSLCLCCTGVVSFCDVLCHVHAGHLLCLWHECV